VNLFDELARRAEHCVREKDLIVELEDVQWNRVFFFFSVAKEDVYVKIKVLPGAF
jgi:hypothetical protein